MNRRTSIARFFGRQQATIPKPILNANTSFRPYQGAWTIDQAAHLLRRTTFGPTPAQLKQAVEDGLSTTITKLFAAQPIPAPPIYFNFEDDPEVPNGQTWVDVIENNNIDGLRNKRRQSLLTWTVKNIFDSAKNITIREKMTIFWHNHFVVSNPVRARMYYSYYTKLRKYALGNFKELVEEITIDAAMLTFLDGRKNSKNAPNENFSRELLELFTIGKGPLAGPGDYTNYTEQDVAELARALTGWVYDTSEGKDPNNSYYKANRHDKGEKQLSPRFDNVVIEDAGDQEYKNVIEIILQKEEVARFISRKIYNWFLHEEITPAVEANIIEPMAQMLIANKYEIQPTVEALVSSEHFYDKTFRGCMVNHPADFLFKIVNTFQLNLPEDSIERYEIFLAIYKELAEMDMALFYHPTVAGWKAFYQAPQYTKIWINSVSLPLRQMLSDRLVKGFNKNGFRIELDVLEFIAQLDNPTEPNDLINELATLLFAQAITEEQLVALKSILLPGLPDYEWTVEYSDFLSGDVSLKKSIEDRVQALIKTMLRMPEFYLI